MRCSPKEDNEFGLLEWAEVALIPQPLFPKREKGSRIEVPLPLWATVYTQVIESLSVLFLPHPNPPLIKGRELDFLVSHLSKGGLRGVT
jgi:hypothetical protein